MNRTAQQSPGQTARLFKVDLLLGNVDGFTNYLRSRDTDRVRQA